MKRKIPPEQLLLGWETGENQPPPVGFAPVSPPPDRKPKRKPWHTPNGESHLLTVAPTGSGKGRSAIIPTCLDWEGSLMVIDPKGEAAATTARHRREMGHETVVLDPFGITGSESASFNPFDIRPHTDMNIEEMSFFIPGLLHPECDPQSKKDPFWDIKADSLVAGICGYLMSGIPEVPCDLSKARSVLMGDDPVYNLAFVLDTVGKRIPKTCYENIASFLGTEDRCRSGIHATAQQHFEIYGEERTSRALRTTSFDLGAFRDGKPITVYIVVPPDRFRSHGPLLRLWTGALLALAKSRRQRPEKPTLFLIDEAAQLGRMQSLIEAVTLLRGYGIRTWSFWQSYGQLEGIYGKDAATIIDNCGVVQCFGVNNYRMAKELTGILGENTSPAELLNLPRSRQIVLTDGGKTHRLKKLDYLKDKVFRGHFDPNPYYPER